MENKTKENKTKRGARKRVWYSSENKKQNTAKKRKGGENLMEATRTCGQESKPPSDVAPDQNPIRPVASTPTHTSRNATQLCQIIT